MKFPSLEVVVAINASVRHDDEWFDEEDEVHRVEKILEELRIESDPLHAAALATGRIARSQAFTEGNKRTALLVGRWILDRNGLIGSLIIPDDDFELAKLLLEAARGTEVTERILSLFQSRWLVVPDESEGS